MAEGNKISIKITGESSPRKVLNCLSMFLNVMDKISCIVLGLLAIGTILNLDLFAYNVDNYDDETRTAYYCVKCIFLSIFFLTILFLLKNKYPKIRYIEFIGWMFLFLLVPYLLYQISSVERLYDNNICQENIK